MIHTHTTSPEIPPSLQTCLPLSSASFETREHLNSNHACADATAAQYYPHSHQQRLCKTRRPCCSNVESRGPGQPPVLPVALAG
ncbi:hypothetical protein J1614_001748 [Plenodomus biglobosus]|nr:hypothetical protein J1614_001748 [Plenodomus biglobosus]